MKKVAAILVFVTFFISGQAYARTEAEVQKDLIKAATITASVYRKDGMSGLIEKTQTCYNNTNEDGFYCLYFDLASRHIDQIAVEGAAQQGMKFPKTPFFDDDLFGARASLLFQKANMDMKTSNDYLQSLTPVINKLVEDNISNTEQQPISKEKSPVSTDVSEAYPPTAQQNVKQKSESPTQANQQKSGDNKKQAVKYIIILLLLISIVSVILHFSGKLVLYKDYTDAAMTIGGTLGAGVIFLVCRIFLDLSIVESGTITFLFFFIFFIFVFRMTYVTNNNVVYTMLSLLTKYMIASLYAILLLGLLFSSGSSKRDGESSVDFVLRKQREQTQSKALMAIVTALFVWFVHATTKFKEWSPISDYFSLSLRKINFDRVGSANSNE
jgi:hypothetical protein